MAKTTIYPSDELHKKVKLLALQKETNYNALVLLALELLTDKKVLDYLLHLLVQQKFEFWGTEFLTEEEILLNELIQINLKKFMVKD